MKFIVILVLSLLTISLSANSPRIRAPYLLDEYDVEDIKAEIKFGKELAAKILNKYPLVENDTIQKYVNRIGSGVASFIGRSELNYIFGVIKTDHINAYACPGGLIFITEGLLKMMKNEAHLVGVISHEIGHINRRHIVKEIGIRGGGDLSRITRSFIGGSTESLRAAFTLMLNKAFNILFEKGLDHKYEFEADQVSASSMLALNYNLNSYNIFLDNLGRHAENGQNASLRRTHPPMKERINRVVQKTGTLLTEGKVNKERFIKNVSS